MRLLLSTVAILLLAANAYADELTDWGEVAELLVIAEGSDDLGRFRGELVLRIDGIDSVYTWGGSTCPGRDLTESQVELLQNAALAPYMRVRLRTKIGQGGADCIVGMRFSNSKFRVQ